MKKKTHHKQKRWGAGIALVLFLGFSLLVYLSFFRRPAKLTAFGTLAELESYFDRHGLVTDTVPVPGKTWLWKDDDGYIITAEAPTLTLYSFDPDVPVLIGQDKKQEKQDLIQIEAEVLQALRKLGFTANQGNILASATEGGYGFIRQAVEFGETRCSVTTWLEGPYYVEIGCMDGWPSNYDEQRKIADDVGYRDRYAPISRSDWNSSKWKKVDTLSLPGLFSEGYSILKNVAGQWQEVVAHTMEPPSCEVVWKYQIPFEIAATCYNFEKEVINSWFSESGLFK